MNLREVAKRITDDLELCIILERELAIPRIDELLTAEFGELFERIEELGSAFSSISDSDVVCIPNVVSHAIEAVLNAVPTERGEENKQ